MTDQKSWLWRKKPLEKTIVVTDKVDLTSEGNEQEVQVLLAEKAELERDLRDLSNRLSSVISESRAKDDLVKKHAKTAQDALAGWEKAEAKAVSLKQELDEAQKQKETSEDRIHHLDAALKECMMQLRFVREDQERRIHDVLLKASGELEETKMFLEEKLAESGKKIAKLTAENSQLNKVLFLREQLIEELNQQRAKAEVDFKALLGRMEIMEKENNSLRYEVRILEKEVDIRNEEREFNLRAADAAHKQHLDNVKKIAKLESECQRLRVLVRKRLPGPAALAKMKSEVDLLQRDSMGNRRKKSSNLGNLQLGYGEDSYPESPSKKIDLLTERISTLEEENSSLRETLTKKMNELQVSRNMCVQTASKLSQVETHSEESPKGQIISDIRRSSMMSHDAYLTSMSDVGSDDKVSCAGSWASALISELDQFKDGKDKVLLSKSGGRSDINHLMDDFLEMEKLALVCVDKPNENPSMGNSESSLNSLSETTGKELVPVSIPSMDDANLAIASSREQLQSDMSISISKLIELIEAINLPSHEDALQAPNRKNGSSETSTGYFARVFQWKTSELAAVLENFLHTCDDLLHGRTNFEKFTHELTCSLEWIINHCFSLQDVSSMKDAMRKRFDWDETRSESEIDMGMSGIGQFPDAAKLSMLKEQLVSTPLKATNDYHNYMQSDLSVESGNLKDSERSMKLEQELHSATQDCESLRNQLQKSETSIANLEAELKALTDSKIMIEDQFENHKMTIEDLNSQLKAVRSELEEANQRFTSQEAELKNKLDHCQGLESKCLDLQLQLERVTKMDSKEHVDQEEKQLRTEWEISAASEKLAECQETILHLGKQLQALTSSRDIVVSDKFISTTTNTNTNIATVHNTTNPTMTVEKKITTQRSSLLDQMLAEDDAEAEQLESPKTKEMICSKDFSSGPTIKPITGSSVDKNRNETPVGSLAIVPIKKQTTSSSGLFKKLLWRRKKGSSKKKMPITFGV